MKVTIALLLVAVGACSAAFSGSLVQQSEPILAQAAVDAYVSGAVTNDDRDLSSIAQAILQKVVERATALIQQIQALQTEAGTVVTSFQTQIAASIAGLQQAAHIATGAIKVQIEELIRRLQALVGRPNQEVAGKAQTTSQQNLVVILIQQARALIAQAAASGKPLTGIQKIQLQWALYTVEQAHQVVTNAEIKAELAQLIAQLQSLIPEQYTNKQDGPQQLVQRLIQQVKALLKQVVAGRPLSGIQAVQLEGALFTVQQAIEVTVGAVKEELEKLHAQLNALVNGPRALENAFVDRNAELINALIARVTALIASLTQQVQATAGALPGLVQGQIEQAINALEQVQQTSTNVVIKAIVARLIASLQTLSAGIVPQQVDARQLVAQLDISSLIQGALQGVINHPFIQSLIAQLKPFLDQAKPIIDQVIAILAGNQPVSRSIPRDLATIIQQFRDMLERLQAVIGQGVAGVQTMVESWIQTVVAQGHESAQTVAQGILNTINKLPGFLQNQLSPMIPHLVAIANGQQLSF